MVDEPAKLSPKMKARANVQRLRERFRKRLLQFHAGVEYPTLDIEADLLLEDVGYANPDLLLRDITWGRKEARRAYQRNYYQTRKEEIWEKRHPLPPIVEDNKQDV